MMAGQPHARWIGIFGLAVLIGMLSGPMLGLVQRSANQKHDALKAENERLSEALRQLQEDTAAAEKMKADIDLPSARKFLAPADRLRAAKIVESRAYEARLSNLSYTLSPEQKAVFETPGSGKQELATSRLTLTADAPVDTNAYVFLDALSRTLPGHLTLREIKLQRLGKAGAPVGKANIRFSATADWLSNGVAKNLAEKD